MCIFGSRVFLIRKPSAPASLAAAHGGYTAVCAMPNLNPVPDSLEHLRPELDAIRQGRGDPRPALRRALRRANKGAKLADLDAMAPYVVAFSDDGKGVQDREHDARGHAARQGSWAG